MILYLLTWIGTIFGFIFLTYSLATGLYYLSELVEEYSVLSKKIIKYSLVAVLAFHFLLWLEGNIPFSRTLFSFVCTGWYARLLDTFPVIDMTGPVFVIGCVLAGLNHFNWFFFFRSKIFPFAELVSFFGIIVWMVPFMFMISLSANDMTLPAFGEERSGSSGSKKKEGFLKNWLQGILWTNNKRES